MMAETVTDGRCSLPDFGPGDSCAGVTCDEPSVATVTAACVHEHVAVDRCCAAHAVVIQREAPDIICGGCRDAGEAAHECVPRVVIDWDSGEKTIVQEAPQC